MSSQIRNFKDFGIKAEVKSLQGEKIGIYQVFNKEIEVHDYRIQKSKFPEKGNGDRLELEVMVDHRKRVIFTSSVVLQEVIIKIPTDAFPFKTTIVETNKRYEFT